MPSEPQSFEFEVERNVTLHGLRWAPPPETPSEVPPIVMLHGGGANAHWWTPIAKVLSSRFPFLALDFRGHGDSSYPEEHRVGAFNDDLEALVTWLGRDDITLVGHSLGAAVSLDHASRYPNTRGLVLVDLARGSNRNSGRRARLALSLRRTYKSREDAVERFRFLPDTDQAEESLRKEIAEKSVRQETDGRFGYKFDPAWFSLPSKPKPDLKSLQTPTLLVRGETSALLSRTAAESFVAGLPNARFVEVQNAGHHVLVDQPGRLTEILDEFLMGN